jgi:hypothetical protein
MLLYCPQRGRQAPSVWLAQGSCSARPCPAQAAKLLQLRARAPRPRGGLHGSTSIFGLPQASLWRKPRQRQQGRRYQQHTCTAPASACNGEGLLISTGLCPLKCRPWQALQVGSGVPPGFVCKLLLKISLLHAGPGMQEPGSDLHSPEHRRKRQRAGGYFLGITFPDL